MIIHEKYYTVLLFYCFTVFYIPLYFYNYSAILFMRNSVLTKEQVTDISQVCKRLTSVMASMREGMAERVLQMQGLHYQIPEESKNTI